MFGKLIDKLGKIITNQKSVPAKRSNTSSASSINQITQQETNDVQNYAEFLSSFGNNIDQKRAVVSNAKRILVLAGAGSGKTKVLTKRFVHLVKNQNIDRRHILALTFTNEAVRTMRERISADLGIKADALKDNIKTIHSFCSQLLRRHEDFDILEEDTPADIIRIKLLELISNDETLRTDVYDYIKENLLPKIRLADSQKNPVVKDKPTDKFGTPRIMTDAGVLVRSKSERDIANFLTRTGFKWEYEKPAEWADATFRPDFTIEGKIYIEHWCYDEKTPEFQGINKKKYLEHRKWKEDQFRNHEKTLISIEEAEMLDLARLQRRLKNELEQLVSKEIRTQTILEILSLEEYRAALERFVYELLEIINLSKAQLRTSDFLRNAAGTHEKKKVTTFFNVLIPVMEGYNQWLKMYGKKDFNDLIKDAITLLDKDKRARAALREKLRYLLIDEYQDVSHGEVELLKRLVGVNTNVFAVGDDWQSIYGWRGSNVSHILQFEKDFGAYRRIVLPINYRSSKNIVDASTHFIQLNGKLWRKDIRCCEERQSDTSKILQVNAKDDYSGANYVVHKVKKLMTENPTLKSIDFLVLYRSGRNIKLYKQVFREKGLKIPMHTIHWSKGQEFSHVFIIGLKGGLYGFPNVRIDKDIKRVVLDIPLDEKEDEERRIFYVAMTRAKDRLILISENGNESEFVRDIPERYKFIYTGAENKPQTFISSPSTK